MTYDYIKQLSAISRLSLDGHLVEAIRKLVDMCRETGNYAIAEDAERVRDTYMAMLRFAADGVDDPGRDDLRDSVASETLALAMRLSRELAMESDTGIYYSTARTTLGRRGVTLPSLVAEYRKELARLDNDYESLTDPMRTARAEQLLREIFYRIWVTHPLSASDFNAVDEMLETWSPAYARQLTVSAVGLGHTSYYDSKRLEWLLKQYVARNEQEPQVALRALVEAMIGIVRYRRRPLSRRVKNALAAAAETPAWQRDFTAVAIELMRATGTDRLTERMRSGILGAFENLTPELRAKIFNAEGEESLRASGMNPDWEEDLANSQIGENLRKIAELQQKGGDVFMSSFSQLKRYPFFHELANWYLPFYLSHSALASADDDDDQEIMGTLLTKMPIICDSDKYSLMLTMRSAPESQRKQLSKALSMQAEQMSEAIGSLDNTFDRTNYINKYVQNVFRAVKLFRAHDDLFNPFKEDPRPDLLQIEPLRSVRLDSDHHATIAEFYLSNQFWAEAAAAFEDLDREELPDAKRSQKKGYAYEHSGMTAAALQAYDEAEMLSSGSKWTQIQLANLLKKSGNHQRAARFYKAISDADPSDSLYCLLAGESLLKTGDFDEAERMYHKSIYNDPFGIVDEAIRGLAWAQFLKGDTAAAEATIDKALNGHRPVSDDYRIAAYVKWAQKDIPATLMLMRLAMGQAPDGVDKLEADILVEEENLKKAGVDTSKRQLLMEILRS